MSVDLVVCILSQSSESFTRALQGVATGDHHGNIKMWLVGEDGSAQLHGEMHHGRGDVLSLAVLNDAQLASR